VLKLGAIPCTILCSGRSTFALGQTLVILQLWRALLLTAEPDRYDSS